MRKIVILFLYFFVQIFYSQTIAPKIPSLPSSPEAAMLGKFGDIPVGYYTGTADITIPLYNLSLNNITIPLNLTYQSSGIKVADEATWVGLGWNFSPEGTIIQEIRGKDDREDMTLYTNNVDNYNYFKDHFGTVLNEDYMLRMQKGCGLIPLCSHYANEAPFVDSDDVMTRLSDGNGEPDIYSYNFGNYSGKFYVNPETYQIVMLEKENSIKFERNGSTWKATTKEGDVYYFNTIETISGTSNKFANVKGYTFKVSEIKLVSGKSIYFNYTEDVDFHSSAIETSHITNFSNSPSNGGYLDVFYSFRNLLTSIETEDTKIILSLGNREDIMPANTQNPAKKLDRIDIISKQNNKKIKSFKFNYTYFDYDTNYSYKFYNANNNLPQSQIEYLGKRLKLDKIDLINYIQDQEEPNNSSYKFEYNTSKKMPLKISNSVDYYGFFNGENNNTSLPDLDYFDYFYTEQYKQKQELGLKYPYIGGKRYFNVNFASANILNKIVYPTMGYTKFEFEPNTFNNQFIPDKTLHDLAFKKNNLINAGHISYSNNYIKDFTINKSATFIFENEINDGYSTYSNSNAPIYTYNQMSGFKIEFYKTWTDNTGAHTQIIKTWDLSSVTTSDFSSNHGKQWHDEIRIEYENNPTLQYHVKINTPNNFYLSNDTYHIAGMKSTFNYYDNTGVDTSTSFGGGLRIKSIKNYDNNHQLISNKGFKYFGGKLINKFEPLSFILHASYKERPAVVNNGCIEENYSIFNDISVNSKDFGLGNLLVGYDKVEQTETSFIDNSTKGKKMFYYYNSEIIKPKNLPQINNNNGAIYKEESYDSSGFKLVEKLYNYGFFSTENYAFPGFKILKNTLGPEYPLTNVYPTIVSGCNNSGIRNFTFDNNFNFTAYSFWKYPIISKKYYLNSEQTTQFFPNNNSLTTVINYGYNSQNLLNSEKTTFPGNIVKEVKYFYANDKSNQYLIGKNIVGVPLESSEIKTENGINSTISSVEVKYPISDSDANTKTSGLPLPYKVENKNLYGSSTKEELTFDKYDNKGNVQQFTTKGLSTTTIIWGYNQTQPIIKIQGIGYETFMAISGVSTLINDIIGKSNSDIDINTEQILLTALDNLRANNDLKSYLITTYTYDPLIGVTTITPPSGIREKYNYDTGNRLQSIVDVNGKILKEFKYNYTTTVVPLYYNVEKIQTFIKNNCNDGFQGNNYIYTVPADSYSSSVSQVDADNLAQNDINSNGQTAANNFGTCSAAPIVTCTFTKNPTLSLSSFNPLFSDSSSQGNLGKLDITFNSSSSYAWANQTLIGYISSSCIPTINRNINYSENGRTWSVDIKTNGEVYLKFVSGSNFYSNTTIIFNIQYLK